MVPPMFEASVRLYESSVQEWDWKASRARLKMNDLEQAKKELPMRPPVTVIGGEKS